MVDGTDPDVRIPGHAGIDLDGRLAVEVDGRVDDAAAVFQGIGRRVRPAPAQIETGRGAAPDDLVLAQGALRMILGRGWLGRWSGRRSRTPRRLPPAPTRPRSPRKARESSARLRARLFLRRRGRPRLRAIISSDAGTLYGRRGSGRPSPGCGGSWKPRGFPSRETGIFAPDCRGLP